MGTRTGMLTPTRLPRLHLEAARLQSLLRRGLFARWWLRLRSPPGAADVKRLIGGVPASFWPRMPCLTCGSPWWRGDDWDAQCANCGASADDYDDDQKPRLHRRQQHEAFRADLEAARAAGRASLTV